MDVPGRIKKLDEVVVNRIAAGEIIQRPANALKELIENCLDAKANQIIITAKDGGMKLLQIQDNGTGINKEDLDIVCERFTTSKLKDFDDLKSITTFGFRGEALASISHVAQLTITTKTATEKCAYKATYIDGKMKGSPTPCAGNQGTIITVENLFYNVSTRRKALCNSLEEYSKIQEVATKYAIHNAHVGFTLKKHGDHGVKFRTPPKSSKIDNVRLLYGNEVARELLDIELDDTSYKFKLHALVTHPNYQNKKLIMLIFINNRLVESTLIKKVLEDMYLPYVPKKSHPWIYISLHINPSNIDVNVHPTKQEVRFCHEDVIVEKIRNAIDEKLVKANDSRTFYIQAKLPPTDFSLEALQDILPEDADPKKFYPKDFVRTSADDQKLDKFNFTINKSSAQSEPKKKSCETEKNEEGTLKIAEGSLTNTMEPDNNEKTDNNNSQLSENMLPTDIEEDKSKKKNEDDVLKNAENISSISMEFDDPDDENEKSDDVNLNLEESNLEEKSVDNSNLDMMDESDENPSPKKDRSPIEFKSFSVNQVQVETKLLSVLTLRKEVEDNYHDGLRYVLSNLVFVGCVDECTALIQSGSKLFLTDTTKLAEELFYQIMLYDFANFGVIKFSEPLLIKDLALIGLECEEAGWTEEEGDKETLAERVQELLLEKADMLRQYFSIYIDKHGNLKSLPILIEKYFPSPGEIPLYILRLSTEVNWSKEKPCFNDICRETAKFYSRIDANNDTWKETTELIIYSAIKDTLLPPKSFTQDSIILQLTSLQDLYKVFERC